MVVGVLIKGMDYLFASRWHFACLPNSCCGLSTALAWMTALHWLYCRHIWSYTQILLLTDAFSVTHQYFPKNFIPVRAEETLKKCYDGTHTECRITYSLKAGTEFEFGRNRFFYVFHILN